MQNTDQAVSRPRVEGLREQEILDATMHVLEEVGYDRLTLDAVATVARASKATLYRRWNDKVTLVIDALASNHPVEEVADTGDLRTDLIATYCGHGGLGNKHAVGAFGAVLTAVFRNEEFAAAFRERIIGPKAAASRAVFARARARGEIGDHVDLDLVAPALAGIVLHRVFLLGATPDDDLVARVVDEIVLPAVQRPALSETSTSQHHSPHPWKDPS